MAIEDLCFKQAYKYPRLGKQQMRNFTFHMKQF